MVADRGEKTGAAGREAEAFVAMLSAVPPLVLPPLMAPTAGAFAAATVMGLGIANQIAGAYLGFLKGAVETGRMMADVMGAPEAERLPDEGNAQAVARPPSDATNVVALKPARQATEAKPARRKPAAKPAGEKKKASAREATATVASTEGAAERGLRQLPGVGPKLEALLKARGLGTLEAIAGLSDADASALDKDLGLDGRIARDGWVEKAAILARG